MISEIKTKKTYDSAIHSVLGELKYRIIYSFLLVTALVTFIYFNFGFYIEFQGSYYLNYYQCIDFNWSEGVKELNENLAFSSRLFNELGADLQGLRIGDKPMSSTQTLPGYVSLLHLLEGLGPTPLTMEAKEPFQQSQPIAIEIDEFKQFFVNFVIYFSGHVTFLYDLSASYFNKPFNTQDPSQPLVFNFYVMLLFYQLTAFFAYHTFCFLSPATTKQFRLKLLCGLQMLFGILLIHFLALPYTISINEELAIENLDSELFFSVNFDLLNSWVGCFYYLFISMGLFTVYFFYLKTPILASKM